MKILLGILFLSLPLFAQDFAFDKEQGKAVPNYIGQVSLLKGKAFKVSGPNTSPVAIGSRFTKDDVLQTEDKSFVKLMIVDDTVLSVGPKSEMKFAEFRFTDKKNRSLVYELVKGQLSGHVKNKVEGESRVNIRTKFATMGVRGTQILVNHQSLSGKEISQFALLSGKAEVSSGEQAAQPIIRGEELILVQDSSSGKSAGEKRSLSEEQLKLLDSLEKDEMKEFKPFLPYLKLDEISESSTLYSMLQKTSAAGKGAVEAQTTGANEPDAPGLDTKLEKLNEKLKQYQKPR